MGFGFFTQPSKFFHTLYFQSKDLYQTSTNQDPTVLYEPSDQRCEIGVKCLSYRNSYRETREVIVRNFRLPAASITRGREDCNIITII